MELDDRIAAVDQTKKVQKYAKLYHPYAYEEFKNLLLPYLWMTSSKTVLGASSDKVIVDEERFWLEAGRSVL